jgi:hypothetical protein
MEGKGVEVDDGIASCFSDENFNLDVILQSQSCRFVINIGKTLGVPYLLMLPCIPKVSLIATF